MKSVEFLEQNASSTPSKLRERAEWRRANRDWLRKSQQIAMTIMSHMDELGMTQKELAQKLGVSPQYVNKVLRGTENLSLDTICKFEGILGCELIRTNAFTIKHTVRVVNGLKPMPNKIEQPYTARMLIKAPVNNNIARIVNLTA